MLAALYGIYIEEPDPLFEGVSFVFFSEKRVNLDDLERIEIESNIFTDLFTKIEKL